MGYQNKTNKTVLKENLVVSGILGVTVLSGALLTLPSALADDVVDTVTITVPTSCSISSTGENSHTAEISNGQSNSAIGETTIKAFCNDNEGFAIYAIGYTDNELGKNVLTNSTLGSTHDIVTGTAITGNTSQWAMKLSTIDSPTPAYPIIIAGSTADTLKQQTDPDFSNFTNVPDDYKKVAYRTASTDVNSEGSNTAEGSTLKTTYQAYISPTQAAGEYTGQVKYTMIHPHNASAPEKPLGLCTDSDTCMQQQTTASLAQKLPNVGDTTTLYDARDNQAYQVAKLADNKYWMVENLNLAGGAELSSTDTDFESTYTLPSTDGWTTNNSKLVLPTSATITSGTWLDSAQFDTDNYAYVFNSGNTTCSSTSPCYSYYSWDAATLGSGRTLNTGNTDAPYSICPKGWRLPTSRTTSATNWQTEPDFYVLAHQYGLDSTTSTHEDDNGFYTQAGPGTVPNFLLAGFYLSGSFYVGGSYGNYWSSTSSSNYADAGDLGFASSFVSSAGSSNRRYGFSVRCVYGS